MNKFNDFNIDIYRKITESVELKYSGLEKTIIGMFNKGYIDSERLLKIIEPIIDECKKYRIEFFLKNSDKMNDFSFRINYILKELENLESKIKSLISKKTKVKLKLSYLIDISKHNIEDSIKVISLKKEIDDNTKSSEINGTIHEASIESISDAISESHGKQTSKEISSYIGSSGINSVKDYDVYKKIYDCIKQYKEHYGELPSPIEIASILDLPDELVEDALNKYKKSIDNEGMLL